MKARINRNQVVCDHCWKPIGRGHELGLWSAGTTPRAFCGYLCLREWLTRMLARDRAETDAYSEALGRAAAAIQAEPLPADALLVAAGLSSFTDEMAAA